MGSPPNHKGRKLSKIGALSNANLMLALMEGTYTCKQLAEQTGLHTHTVNAYTRALHQVAACHICAWEDDSRGRQVVRVFQLGAGVDMKQPKMSAAAKSQRYRDKQAHLKMMAMMAA